MSQAQRSTGQDLTVITRADALLCRPIHFNASVIGWTKGATDGKSSGSTRSREYLASRLDRRSAPVASDPHRRERGDLRRQMALPGTPDDRARGEHLAYLGRLCRPRRSSRRGVDRPAFWHFPNLQAPAAALAGAIGRGRDVAC